MSSVSVVTAFNNFARAQVDHDLDGRFDLPIYQSGAKAFENFISNFKGNAIYRAGYSRMLDFRDAGLLEFRFSRNQNYLLGLYANKIRFASYAAGNVFGWVLDGFSNILEVDTPYTLDQSKSICKRKSFTQNFDSIIVAINGLEPRELKRLSANSFRFLPFSRKDDPFPTTWAATKNITGVTQATEAVVTIVAHGYAVGDRFKVVGVTGMTELNNWTAAVVAVVDADNVRVDIDTTTFTAYAGSGTSAKVTAGDYPNTCLYRKGRLWYAATSNKPTTVFASQDGQFKVHTLPTVVLPESALQLTLAELDAPIDWLVNGSNSLIVGTANTILALNGGSVGESITAENIETTTTDADGSSVAMPLAKDGLIFYINNEQRRTLYFSYDLLSETFGADDANVIAYDITKGGIDKIRYVKNREDLIFARRADGTLVSCNFNKKEKIIGWHVHPSFGTTHDIAAISDNNGVQQLFMLNQYGSNYYIECQAPYKEFSRRKDFTTALNALDTDATQETRDEAEVADDEAHYRKISEELKECIYLDNADVVSDLRSTTLTYDSGTGRITASAASFLLANVGRHISYKTATGYEHGRFLITGFVSTTVVDVTVLQEPTTNSYSSWYMSFNSLSGLSRFNGTQVKVAADGGFLDDFTVSGGTIALNTEVNSAVVGYGYRGFIESFVLGFAVQGENTQITEKVISRVGLRMHDTMGGRFGTSRYRLDPVQKLTQVDLNYLPPKPINETVYVDYSDDHNDDKGFVLEQDVPLPMVVAAAMVDANYAVTR